MNQVHKALSFVRWRLVPVRYATMVGGLRWAKLGKPAPPLWSSTEQMNALGYAPGPTIPPDLLQDMLAVYTPRTASVQPKPTGHPFVNLFSADDISPDNPIVRFAFSPQVLDCAIDYFGNKLILDSLQVLYSWPTEGPLRESQHWHLDYGDTKAFHCVAYLTDVTNQEHGPFVFVDKPTSAKVGRSAVVRRIDDPQFSKEAGTSEFQTFYGKAGSSVLVDPSACYHYGSRCRTPRLAVFVTFSTWFPFAQPVPAITENTTRLEATLKAVRPDLSTALVRSLLQLA